MKHTDFRIGNLVNKGTVSGISQAFNGAPYDIEVMSKGGLFSNIPIEEIEPIPLDAEWLERAGLEKTSVSTDEYPIYKLQFDCGGYLIYNPTYKELELCRDGRWCFNINVRYVHALQNGYYFLTGGTELKIEI